MNVNANLMVKNVTQIKSTTTKNVDVSAKIRENIYVKKIFLESYYMTCKNGKYLGSISGNSVITCDEIIEVTKTVSTKTATTKTNKFLYFNHLFYDYNITLETCKYLLLLHKTLIKIRTFITITQHK